MLDTGATSSAISLKKAKQLGLRIFPTKSKLVQVDESYLEVCGEIHTSFYRENIKLNFSAIVVKKMGFDIIGGTNFLKENDVYCRLSTNKIVIKGVHSYNSTPYIATLNEMQAVQGEGVNCEKVLIKANRTETLLPGESQVFSVDQDLYQNDEVVEIEPRNEAPAMFPSHHFQTIELNTIRITNDSKEPVKIKTSWG